MSGYWDAVERAALGLAGSAEPRPLSLFEFDPALPEQPDPEVVEQNPDARRPPSAPAAHPAPAVEPSASDTAEADAAADRPIPAMPRDEMRTVADARIAAPPAQPQPVVSDDGDRRAPPMPPVEQATRVEVHHIETSQVIVEARERQSPAIGPDDPLPEMALPATPPDQSPGPAAIETALSQMAIERPPVVPAEPVAAAPEPAQRAAAPELAPLVIEIGRIDIRIATEAPAPIPMRPRASSTALSLNDYLDLRSKAER